jgi:hypothetical protein
MNKNIKEMSLEELKSLAYDQLVELNRVQNNVNVLEAEIQLRNKPVEVKEEKK